MVDLCYSITPKIWTPIFEWCVVRCGSKNGQLKYVFKRDWTTCLKYVTHSRFNGQHNLGDLYDHLISTIIFTSIRNKMLL